MCVGLLVCMWISFVSCIINAIVSTFHPCCTYPYTFLTSSKHTFIHSTLDQWTMVQQERTICIRESLTFEWDHKSVIRRLQPSKYDCRLRVSWIESDFPSHRTDVQHNTGEMVTRVCHWCIHAGFSNHNAQSRIKHHANESDDTTTEAPNHHLLCVLTAHKNEMSCSSHDVVHLNQLNQLNCLQWNGMEWRNTQRRQRRPVMLCSLVDGTNTRALSSWWNTFINRILMIIFVSSRRMEDSKADRCNEKNWRV